MAKILIKGTPTPKSNKAISVKKTLQPVDRKDSNMEVERQEFIVTDTLHTGFPETYVAGGQPHSNGGTPVNLPENSFIFSKDKSLKLKDEEVQKSFGQKEKKTGYVFADIAKKYNVNDYRKVLADPDSDNLQRDTAEQMIKNYNEKLGKLALVQESMKGMPQGIPFISVPYLESMGINPAQFVHGGNGDEPEVPTQQEEQDTPQMKKGGSFKIKVLKKPSYQKGGPTGAKESVYSPAQLENMQKLKEMGYDISIPSTVHEQKGAVEKVQKKLPTNVYGRTDWTKPELFQDFQKRAAWYLKDHPNFDPTDKGDVEDFQKAYNDKLEGMGLNREIPEDAKFGEHTYSVYDLNKKQAPPTQKFTQSSELSSFQQSLQKPMFDPKVTSEDTPFWTQDIVNMAGAFGDLQRIKKYMPWQAGYSTQLPEGIYYDPTRELAASAEQANISAQALGAFAGPQALSARLSEIQGQGLENAANILGKYNNLNVGEANALESVRKNILNTSSANRADQATGLFDKTTMVNQQFDNARAEARQKLRQSFIDAWTNRGKTQALNVMNKQYKVDPRTGYVTMTGVPGQIMSAGQTAQIEDTFNKLMKNLNLKANPEIAYKLALKAHGQE